MRTENDENGRFPIAKRGYDPNAVEAYLDLTAADSDRMLNEAAARIAALELELEEARKQEEAVHLTILAATKAKEDMIEAAKHQAAELTTNGRKEGDRIVTDARMQAFQLVTGARKEAETIVGEARAEAAAIARVEGDAAETDGGPSERELALQQRVEEMQDAIAAMELELASRPAASDESVTTPVEAAVEETGDVPVAALETDDSSEAAPPPEATAEAPPPVEDVQDEDAHIEIVVSDEPVVEPTIEIADDETEISLNDDAETLVSVGGTPSPDADGGDAVDDRAAAVRRSFYSRRSAGLPHLGSEAGRGAMAAVAGLRTSFVATEAEAGDDTDPDQTPAFEAV